MEISVAQKVPEKLIDAHIIYQYGIVLDCIINLLDPNRDVNCLMYIKFLLWI